MAWLRQEVTVVTDLPDPMQPAPPDPLPDREFRPVKSAYRALDVLEAIAAGPSTLSELSRLLDIPKSSLHGLMRTLIERGWVTTTDGGTRLPLGLPAPPGGAPLRRRGRPRRPGRPELGPAGRGHRGARAACPPRRQPRGVS